MLTLFHVLVARIRGHLRSDDLDRDFEQELTTHLRMSEEDKVRRGMTPERARRAARVELGGVTQLRDMGRSARGLPWVGGFWLDVRLGVRMLARHPAVTVVIVFALGLGIPASLTPHLVLDAVFDTPLPLDEGDRVRALVFWNQARGEQELPRLDEYELWRDGLTTIESLGSAMPQSFNLIAADGSSAPVRGAMMSASSFTMTRVPPLLGRTLTGADERPGAPDVAVIGHDLWRSRFGGNRDVVGSTVRIAGTPTTVVGVMPEGYAFPNAEQLWVPLRARAADYPPGTGPSLLVYGRLAEGASVAQAQAELEVLGRRAAVTDAAGVGVATRRRPDVAPFSTLSVPEPRGRLRVLLSFVQLVPIALLVIACGNVAVLLLARTASRSGEFAIRTALGAGRGRIVAQLFTETLVLATLATGVGLLLLHLLLSRLDPLIQGAPHWLALRVTPEIAFEAFALAILSAVLAGVLPGLRATGHNLRDTFQHTGGTGGALRVGRFADALIVLEVAIGVGALYGGIMAYRVFAPVAHERLQAVEEDRFLAAVVSVPRVISNEPTASIEPPADDPDRHEARIAASHRELARRLRAEPDVRSVTIADAPPGGEYRERRSRFADDDLPADFPGFSTVVSYVDLDFFRALEVAPVRGRLFEATDVPVEPGTTATSVVVNSRFVERRGGIDVVGRPLRLELDDGPLRPASPVFEIVGVVPDVVANAADALMDGTPVVYLPAVPGEVQPFTVIVDVGSAPTSFAPRLRQIVADADPAAMVVSVGALDEPDGQARIGIWSLLGLGGLALIAIVLSSAALYALMSFTVARRTREIGIRTALGGSAPRIVATIARRALVQIGVGVGTGAVFWILVLRLATGGWGTGASGSGDLAASTAHWPLALLLTAGAVLAVGLTACAVPTLKGIRIRPLDALRAE
jgi:predicted permease